MCSGVQLAGGTGVVAISTGCLWHLVSGWSIFRLAWVGKVDKCTQFVCVQDGRSEVGGLAISLNPKQRKAVEAELRSLREKHGNVLSEESSHLPPSSPPLVSPFLRPSILPPSLLPPPSTVLLPHPFNPPPLSSPSALFLAANLPPSSLLPPPFRLLPPFSFSRSSIHPAPSAFSLLPMSSALLPTLHPRAPPSPAPISLLPHLRCKEGKRGSTRCKLRSHGTPRRSSRSGRRAFPSPHSLPSPSFAASRPF